MGMVSYFMDADEEIYLGSSNPDLVPEYHWGGGISSFLTWIIPDINGDGKDDITAAEFEHQVNIFLGADTILDEPTVTLNFQGR